MLAYVLAVGAALCNALSSILQRRAAAPAGDDKASGLKLIVYLLHRPAWFGGIAALVVSFLFQAGALSVGRLSQVQPVLATELLFVLVILVLWFHRPVGKREWFAAGAIVLGLVVFLAAADPSEGSSRNASLLGWVVTGAAVAVAVVVALGVSRGGSGARQAAALGTASGLVFALTAAVTKAFTVALRHHGFLAFAGWTPYAVGACGLGATWLSNNAFERGPVTAAQPALTIVDPLASIIIGIALFSDRLRGGALLLLEVLGLAMLVGGVLVLSRSPLVSGDDGNSELQGGSQPQGDHGQSEEEPSPAGDPSPRPAQAT